MNIKKILSKKENIVFLVIAALSVVVVLLLAQNYILRQNIIALENTLKTYQYNEKVLDFAKLFITKVLKAEGEVSFEDRLRLENMVRTINNKTIFDEWQKFINSKTETEAQIEVKNLLETLVTKITY
jgi:hypothetical protein